MITLPYIKIFRGKFKKILFTVTDADTQDPIDITSHTFKFTVKRSIRDLDAAAVLEKSSSNGISIVDGAAGKGQILIDSVDTQDLPLVEQEIIWDLQIVRDGNPEIVADGKGLIAIPVTLASS